jgi:UDP-N-acetylmuramoylalanine--D-glutamate ligase
MGVADGSTMSASTGKLRDKLKPQQVLVYGLGRSGLGVIRHLERLGWTGAWFDQAESPVGAEEAITKGFPRLPNLESDQMKSGGFDLVVAAPGVMFLHPDLVRLRATGFETIGEAELCFRTLTTPTIGVTGTAGKGSTTALIAHLLRAQNLNALEGGNFDPALLEIAEQCDVAVTELSSFQLERIVSYRPSVAVLTNLGVDHISDHGSLELYHAAKLKIVQNLQPGDALVVPGGLKLKFITKGRVVRVPESGPILDLQKNTLLELADLPAHQHPTNARLAVIAVGLYLEKIGQACDLEKLRAGLTSFPGVKGRFETIGEFKGTRFIDDSIATRTLAVQAALENAPGPIAWLLGGRDKGAELKSLIEIALEKVAVICFFGEAGDKLARPFRKAGVRVVDCSASSGEAALEKCVQSGLRFAMGGSIVLAPLGTSFDQFKDYKARGAAFKAVFERVSGLAAESTVGPVAGGAS